MSYFARGCLALVPVAATLYVAFSLVTTLDRLLGVKTWGLGLLIAFALITAVGFLVTSVLGKQLLWVVDAVFSRLPVVQLIYTAIRDLMNAFGGGQQNVGQAVTFRPYPGSELRQTGFLTRDGLDVLDLPEHVAVFVPMAYGLGGQLVLVPREAIEPKAIPPKELLAFAVSGGASGLAKTTEK
jgi:uncharacterized membrane protein